MEITANVYIKNRHYLQPESMLQYMADNHTDKLDDLMKQYFDSLDPPKSSMYSAEIKNSVLQKLRDEMNLMEKEEEDEYHRGYGFKKPRSEVIKSPDYIQSLYRKYPYSKNPFDTNDRD